MKFLLTAILLISGSEVIKCADILVLIPTPFYSHQATFRPLWRELAKRGHKITLITTDPMEKNENITQIDYSGVYSEKKKMESNLYGTTNPLNVFKLTDTAGKILTYQLTHPDLLKLYKEKKKFDLVFVELLLPIFAYLSVKFDCPFIGLNTMDAVPSLHAAVGNAVHPVVYPFNDFGFEGELTFTERLKSIAFTLGYFGIMNPFFGYFGNSYIRKYVGEDIPDIYELQRNVSAIFINANPLFFPTRPVTPITVNLGGGLHLSEPKRLPEVMRFNHSTLIF